MNNQTRAQFAFVIKKIGLNEIKKINLKEFLILNKKEKHILAKLKQKITTIKLKYIHMH